MPFHPDFDRLPPVTDCTGIDLFLDGVPCGRIENRPGQAGSLRIYLACAGPEGRIDRAAAQRALTLYGDYAEEARSHPGSHPNIDRLLGLLNHGETLSLRTRNPTP